MAVDRLDPGVAVGPSDDWLGPVLDGEAVRRRLRLRTIEDIEQLVTQHRLLAVPTGDGVRFPAFQFARNGAP